MDNQHAAGSLFRHGVASGDPLPHQVVIWTRITRPGAAAAPAAEPIPVAWSVAADPDLRELVAHGETIAAAERDWTVHVDVTGLAPGTMYFYWFFALGEGSPVGRTKTLPESTDHLRLAMVSCAKYNAGFFNAFSRIADRPDLDFLLHLGDYIYEAAQKPPASQTPGADIGRPFDPLHECVTLADYRTRYGQYRLDPDVQADARRPADDRHDRRPRACRRGMAQRLGRARRRARWTLGGPAGRRVPGTVGVVAGPATGPGRSGARLPERRLRRPGGPVPHRHAIAA